MRLTITFGYNPGNSFQSFRSISHLELHLDEENHDYTTDFDLPKATLRTNVTYIHSLWIIPQHEIELFNKVIENLLAAVNFQGC